MERAPNFSNFALAAASAVAAVDGQDAARWIARRAVASRRKDVAA